MFMRNLRDTLLNRAAGICYIEGDPADPGAGGGGGDPADPGALWHAGLDADTVGTLQTKGWDKLTPAQAVAEAVKAHREAEKFLGVPKDQLLRRPDANDPASVSAFYQALGKPADKTGYDFTGVKFADGKGLDENVATFLRDTADRLNMTKDGAAALAADYVKFQEVGVAQRMGEQTAAVQADKTALTKEWGQNFEAHKFVAQKGADWAGVSPEEFASLFETPGGAKMLGIFHKIGEMTGEGRFVGPGPGAGNGMMTTAQATARKTTLMQDSAWVTKYNAGGAAELAEMTALNTILTSDASEADFFG